MRMRGASVCPAPSQERKPARARAGEAGVGRGGYPRRGARGTRSAFGWRTSTNPLIHITWLGCWALNCASGTRTACPRAWRPPSERLSGRCREHAAAGIELPYAYFTAGRLSLLLQQGYEALGYYALGIRYCLAGEYCVPADALDEEAHWIHGLHFGVKAPPESQRVLDLLRVGCEAVVGGPSASAAAFALPVLIIAGGAASLDARTDAEDPPASQCGMRALPGHDHLRRHELRRAGLHRRCSRRTRQRRARNCSGSSDIRPRGYRMEFRPTRPTMSESTQATTSCRTRSCGTGRISWPRASSPRMFSLLGFGGGPLSAVEYRIALGLGASVGIVAGTGGAADNLLADPLWSGLPNLYQLPFDSATVRAFVMPSDHDMDPPPKRRWRRTFHAKYVAGSSKRLPPNMRPWDKLEDTFKKANLEQAHYSVEILEAAGFRGAESGRASAILSDFTDAEVERMAELEHGRWNVERLRDGWRSGKTRDDSRKIHDCLVRWEELPDDIKHYDRDAVRAFPEILAKAGLEVRRRS